METYTFGYATQRSSFTIDGQKLNFKISFKKGSIETSNILYFRRFEYQDYDHFIIRHKTAEGKIKNLKAFVDKRHEGLSSLLLRLAELMPEKDLSNTSADEARKLMKVGNAAKGGFIGAAVIIFAILFFIFGKAFKTGETAFMIIGGIIAFILIITLIVVYFQGKNKSKDW